MIVNSKSTWNEAVVYHLTNRLTDIHLTYTAFDKRVRRPLKQLFLQPQIAKLKIARNTPRVSEEFINSCLGYNAKTLHNSRNHSFVRIKVMAQNIMAEILWITRKLLPWTKALSFLQFNTCFVKMTIAFTNRGVIFCC